MHAVFVCFRDLPNYNIDYRIFNMPTQSFNACVYTRVCLHLFSKTEWLPFSLGVGFFFIRQCHEPPFYEILDANATSSASCPRSKVLTCSYFLHGQTLETSASKYLGITISSDLSWSTHVEDVVAQGNRTVRLL